MKKYFTIALGLFVAFGILLSSASISYAHHGRGCGYGGGHGGHGGCYQNQGCLYDADDCPYYNGQRQVRN